MRGRLCPLLVLWHVRSGCVSNLLAIGNDLWLRKCNASLDCAVFGTAVCVRSTESAELRHGPIGSDSRLRRIATAEGPPTVSCVAQSPCFPLASGCTEYWCEIFATTGIYRCPLLPDYGSVFGLYGSHGSFTPVAAPRVVSTAAQAGSVALAGSAHLEDQANQCTVADCQDEYYLAMGVKPDVSRDSAGQRGCCWDAFVRSALFLQLLAFLRLLHTGCVGRCHRRAPLRTRAHCRLRALLKGAPLVLSVGVCMPIARAMPTQQHATWKALDAWSSDGDLSLPDASAEFVVGSVGPPSWRSPEVTVDVSGQIPMPEVHPVGGGPEPPMRFASELLRYQRSSCFTAHVTTHVESVDDLVEEVMDQSELEMTAEKLVVVEPQPYTDRPVFLIVPDRDDVTRWMPVCVQVEVRGARPLFWYDYVEQRCSFAEARDLLGGLFWPGMILYVGVGADPCYEDDVFETRAGMLLRFCFPGRIPRPARSLQQLMSNPIESFSDIEEEGYPETFAVPGATCVLTRLDTPYIVNVRRRADDAEALRIIAESVPSLPLQPCLARPDTAICDVCLRSEGIESTVGVVPALQAAAVWVFVDARCIAVPLKLVLLQARPWTVPDLLYQIGSDCLAPVTVRGGSGQQANSTRGLIRPAAGDVLRFGLLNDPCEGVLEVTAGDSGIDVPSACPVNGPSVSTSADGEVSAAVRDCAVSPSREGAATEVLGEGGQVAVTDADGVTAATSTSERCPP